MAAYKKKINSKKEESDMAWRVQKRHWQVDLCFARFITIFREWMSTLIYCTYPLHKHGNAIFNNAFIASFFAY
jgi:hypothetical protein